MSVNLWTLLHYLDSPAAEHVGSCRDVNRAAIEALGVEREAIIGQRIDHFFAIAPDILVPTAWDDFISDKDQFGVCELLSTGVKFEYRLIKPVRRDDPTENKHLPMKRILLVRSKKPAATVDTHQNDFLMRRLGPKRRRRYPPAQRKGRVDTSHIRQLSKVI